MAVLNRILSLSLGCLCVLLGTSLQAQSFGYPQIVATQEDQRLEEVSGLAPSISQPDFFWAINDGGNGSKLLLLDELGQFKDQVDLAQLGNHDWEDLETFRYGQQNYIAIADIGDNFKRRKVYYIHLVPEPSISNSGVIGAVAQTQIKTIAFQYEDGPRDAEALGVDIEHMRMLVLTKRDKPPRLYSIPLEINPKRLVYRASHLLDISSLGKLSLSGHSLVQTLYAGMPTAMTVLKQASSQSMTSFAVLSYDAVWLFELFNQQPNEVRHLISIQLPDLPQAEALAVDQQGDLRVMSEITGSSIVTIPKLL